MGKERVEIDAIAYQEMLARGERPPEGAVGVRTRRAIDLDLLGNGERTRGKVGTADPALARFDAAQAERERRRDNLLNEAWQGAAREVALFGKAGSPLFLDCVRLLVAFAPGVSPDAKITVIARAYTVPHLAVAEDTRARAEEYATWALTGFGTLDKPGWWREGY